MSNKLVCGVGVYEKGLYTPTTNGLINKEYQRWIHMLKRCQVGGLYQKNNPTYIGCSIHPDFIKFQDFATWCQTQIGFGNVDFELDKDILLPGNKVYGPDTCAFVPSDINIVLTYRKTRKFNHPPGVSWAIRQKKFRSTMRVDAKTVHIGYYTTSESAFNAYKFAKKERIIHLAKLYQDVIDPRIYIALLNHEI